MTTTEKLNKLAQLAALVAETKEEGFLGSLFTSVYIKRDGKTAEEMKETLDWFLDGGSFTSYWKEKVPFGERKNSKKREKTTWFFAVKNGVEMQLGHATTKNYIGDFWERGAEALVKNALCKEGEFSYYNHSFVNYVLEKGVQFKDLGEKK